MNLAFLKTLVELYAQEGWYDFARPGGGSLEPLDVRPGVLADRGRNARYALQEIEKVAASARVALRAMLLVDEYLRRELADDPAQFDGELGPLYDAVDRALSHWGLETEEKRTTALQALR